MKFLLLLTFLLSTWLTNRAQSLNTQLMPDSLIKNANAIIRYNNTDVTIENETKVLVHHSYAITVLNPKGDDYAVYSSTYDPMKNLNDISGTLYDASGKKIRSMKKKDIDDAPFNNHISFMSDTRIKTFDFFYRSYPYTVVFNEEEVYNQTFMLPFWYPVLGNDISVQQSSFSVTFPINMLLHFKVMQNNMLGFDSSITNNTKTFTWQYNFKKAMLPEPLEPNRFETMPTVFLSLLNFQLKNYKGESKSWKDIGLFLNQLNAGRDLLPENIKQQVHLLTDLLTDKQQKITVLYQYIQKNTRYIDIALGIGGWQPYDCKYVAENKYGDCKALSNFMVALLKEAGIKANYVLINATDEHFPFLNDFPNTHFNHATVCIPDGKDTMWLECTDANMPPGYVGHFTDDREALMITDSGGIVVHTPKYSIADNQRTQIVKATIDATGNLNAQVHTLYTGQTGDVVHELYIGGNSLKMQQLYNQIFNLPTYNVENIQINEQKNSIPIINESFDIKINGFAAATGKRLFVHPNIFNQWKLKLEPDEGRKYPIALKENFIQKDTLCIQVPNGYELESLPKPQSIHSDFGEYSIEFIYQQQQIVMIRYQTSIKKSWPPSRYNDLMNFFNAMYQYDRGQVVLKKNI